MGDGVVAGSARAADVLDRLRVARSAGVVTASALIDRAGDSWCAGGFPVPPALSEVLPTGLRRGSVVEVRGSLAMMLSAVSEASMVGSWTAVVGVPDLGIVAAAEAGVEVRRLVMVPRPGSDPAVVIAALLDGIELVIVASTVTLSDRSRRLLVTRVRQRGAVLLTLGRWPGADIELRCRGGAWAGIGRGSGRLRTRRVLVTASGRRVGGPPRRVEVLLPGPRGTLSTVPDDTGVDSDDAATQWRETTVATG